MSEPRKMTPIIESYNVEEEPLYIKSYIFIKGYAQGKNLTHTLKALPLARYIHNGQYRKGQTMIGNKMVQLPYLLHPLKVCSTLISLNLDMNKEELDILCASAILHDAIEDRPDLFPLEGKELVTVYGFPEIIYTTIKLLSKHSGATEFELNEYFNKIKHNVYALLIKLADRSHNVEDLSNFKIEKLHKYTNETRRWLYDLCSYGKQHYPKHSNGFTILKAKIVSLTELTETLVSQYEVKEKELTDEIAQLRAKLEEYEKKSNT